jgi:hypothetical protein
MDIIDTDTVDDLKCNCRKCNVDTLINGIPYSLALMIVCRICGNKRCPHATNHELDCTNSNEPNQPGSVYGGINEAL